MRRVVVTLCAAWMLVAGPPGQGVAAEGSDPLQELAAWSVEAMQPALGCFATHQPPLMNTPHRASHLIEHHARELDECASAVYRPCPLSQEGTVLRERIGNLCREAARTGREHRRRLADLAAAEDRLAEDPENDDLLAAKAEAETRRNESSSRLNELQKEYGKLSGDYAAWVEEMKRRFAPPPAPAAPPPPPPDGGEEGGPDEATTGE